MVAPHTEVRGKAWDDVSFVLAVSVLISFDPAFGGNDETAGIGGWLG